MGWQHPPCGRGSNAAGEVVDIRRTEPGSFRHPILYAPPHVVTTEQELGLWLDLVDWGIAMSPLVPPSQPGAESCHAELVPFGLGVAGLTSPMQHQLRRCLLDTLTRLQTRGRRDPSSDVPLRSSL